MVRPNLRTAACLRFNNHCHPDNTLGTFVARREFSIGPLGQRPVGAHPCDVAGPATRWLFTLGPNEAHKYLLGSRAPDGEGGLPGFLTGGRLAGNWAGAVAEALRLARDFRARVAVDSADVLHVGRALLSGAGGSIFDFHARALGSILPL